MAAGFKSFFLLLVILGAGGGVLATGENSGGPAGGNNNGTVTGPDGTIIISSLELEMLCLYKHWLKHHGERTNYSLLEFELDPRFLLFKSYLEHIPVVPTLESKCLSRKDNSTVIDPPKDNGNGNVRDHQHNNTTTASDSPKGNANSRDNDDKVDHQDGNAINNCNNHDDGGDQNQQPKKKKSMKDKVLDIFLKVMMIVGIITTAGLVAFCLWWCFRQSCGRDDDLV